LPRNVAQHVSKNINLISEEEEKNTQDEIEDRNRFLSKIINPHSDENQENVPLVQRINLDLNFARVGTWMMASKLFLSLLIDKETANNPAKITFFKFLDDFFKKIRQVAQYSIHAQPGLGQRDPDDITSDLVHNLEAAALGKSVYNLNAFVAPWLSVIRVFFPYDKNLVFGLASRMIDFADNTIGKITNLFWNFRRVSKGLIPYDGGVTTEQLTEKQMEVRELISYYWHKHILSPIGMVKQLFSNNQKYVFEENNRKLLLLKLTKDNSLIQGNALSNYWNNILALVTGKYNCPHEIGSKPKEIGTDEPDNQKWYVRLKLLSQVFSLPAGLFGAILNGSSIGVDLVGNLFGNHKIRNLSSKMTDYANGLMSLVYMTGEVPANINEYIKKRNKGVAESEARHNLYVAGIGALGMINRMKILPGIKSLFETVGLKTLLDKYHSTFENFFLLFFSANRLVLHADERKAQALKSSARDLQSAYKHTSWWKKITLPIRVIFRDPDVIYKHDNISFRNNLSTVTNN
jgi:hypothetical protein